MPFGILKIIAGHNFRLLALIAVFLLGGCSYPVLTFFFTGVPDPNRPVAVAETVQEQVDQEESSENAIEGIVEQRNYTHGPWVNGECDSCHQSGSGRRFNALKADGPSMSRLAYPTTELCVGCHTEGRFIGDGRLWVHGPVANRDCLTCHNPHQSNRQFMLKLADNRELCQQCHAPNDLGRTAQHVQDPDQNCIDCHNPHSGDTRLIMREAIET